MIPGPGRTRLLLASVRSKLAYSTPCMMKKLWRSGCQISCNDIILDKWIPAVFDGVNEEPIFMTSQGGSHAEAYSWRQDDTLHITFRGMDGWGDALSTLDVRPYQMVTAVAKVHYGVHEHFCTIESDVLNQIKRHVGDGGLKYVEFAGHSLGGATAIIACALLWQVLGDLGVEMRCYTFGSPRVGNREFVEWYRTLPNLETVRVVNKHDPVPWLPLSTLYLHVPRELKLLNDEGDCEYDHGDDQCGLGRVWRGLSNLKYNDPIAEHYFDSYITRLKKWNDT